LNRDLETAPSLRFDSFVDDWKHTRLGNTSVITTGSTPLTSIAENYDGLLPFVSPADIQNNRYVVDTRTTVSARGFACGREIGVGSVLFVCIGSTIGKVGQANVDCITNQQINALTALNEYDNDFIYLILERNAGRIKRLAGVQAVPQINKTDFSAFKFSFPHLPEQQKIATFLSAVDKKIQQLQRKKELLEQYKKGVMQKIFSQEIRFKDDEGQDYPDWEEKRMGDVFSNVGGTALEKHMSPDGSHKVISIGNYSVDGCYIDNSQRIVLNDLTKAKLLYKDELVMVLNDKTKTGDIIGSTILIDKSNTYIYNQRSERLKCDSIIIPLFAWFYVNSRMFRKSIFAISQGGTQIYVNYSAIKKLCISIPSYAEQQKISEALLVLNKRVEVFNNKISLTIEFKKGLLQQMFV
jgi:type I restriction enzyme, S subunit